MKYTELRSQLDIKIEIRNQNDGVELKKTFTRKTSEIYYITM